LDAKEYEDGRYQPRKWIDLVGAAFADPEHQEFWMATQTSFGPVRSVVLKVFVDRYRKKAT
jgi:hypothetical protein